MPRFAFSVRNRLISFLEGWNCPWWFVRWPERACLYCSRQFVIFAWKRFEHQKLAVLSYAKGTLAIGGMSKKFERAAWSPSSDLRPETFLSLDAEQHQVPFEVLLGSGVGKRIKKVQILVASVKVAAGDAAPHRDPSPAEVQKLEAIEAHCWVVKQKLIPFVKFVVASFVMVVWSQGFARGAVQPPSDLPIQN